MTGGAKRFPGIETRHEKACQSGSGKRCTCKPSYRAVVYDPAIGRNRNGPWGKSLAQARSTQVDLKHKIRRGTLPTPDRTTVESAGAQWLEGARSGAIRNSAGASYKPSTLRSYKSSFQRHIVPTLGRVQLGRLTGRDVQDLVDRLALTLSGSTVHNAIMPLRVICRHARRQGTLTSDPCELLQLPAISGRRFAKGDDGVTREAVATRQEAAQLIAALPSAMDRAIWAAAFYAGLRRGELRGLFLEDVDLQHRLIHIRRAWDLLDGQIATKSYAADRSVPIFQPLLTALTDYLVEHDGGEFIFPGSGRCVTA